VQSVGNFGDAEVALLGTPDTRFYASGDTVPAGAAAPGIPELTAKGDSVATIAVNLSKQLQAQLVDSGGLGDMRQTIARTNALVARLQSPDGSLGKLLDDPALYQNLNGMISSVDSLVRQMRAQNGTFGRLLSDDSLYTHLVGITTGTDSLVRQLTHGDGFAARMLRDEQLYEQLTKTITDLNAILADVRQNPRKYTKGMIKVF
jgi:phospholipid/cholesterol/gamma-HCH transport system substrate-binding protein